MIFDHVYELYLKLQLITGLPSKVLGPLLFYTPGILLSIFLALVYRRDEIKHTGTFHFTWYKAFIIANGCLWGAMLPVIILLSAVFDWLLDRLESVPVIKRGSI